MLNIPAIYPDAKIIGDLDKSPGEFFKGGQPRGIVVHYTADRDLARTIKSLKQQGLAYHLLIDRDGSVHQMSYLTTRVAHAGKAKWGGMSPNAAFLGVSLVSWGLLTFFRNENRLVSWTGAPVDQAETLPGGIDPHDSNKLYFWDCATTPQISALTDICIWFAERGILIKDICGHDECCIPPGRKIDPGGIFPFTMKDLREGLSTIWTMKKEALTLTEEQAREFFAKS